MTNHTEQIARDLHRAAISRIAEAFRPPCDMTDGARLRACVDWALMRPRLDGLSGLDLASPFPTRPPAPVDNLREQLRHLRELLELRDSITAMKADLVEIKNEIELRARLVRGKPAGEA